jgi:hypothetical protein
MFLLRYRFPAPKFSTGFLVVGTPAEHSARQGKSDRVCPSYCLTCSRRCHKLLQNDGLTILIALDVATLYYQ